MSNLKTLILPCAAALLFAVFATSGQADVWNKKTFVTFSGPVEIPGMVLKAGTYTFKLLDSPSTRNIVQIFNKDENHLYATILAIPDYRLKPTGKTVIRFAERPSGSPEAIQAWFYPGDNFGQEFVYPKHRAVELAKRTHQPVLSMPEEISSNITKPATSAQEPSVAEMKKAEVKAEKPSGEEVEITEIVTAPQQQRQIAQAAPVNQLPATANSSETAPVKQLPATASSLPLLALVGLLSLGAGLSIRAWSKRIA